MTQRPVFSSHPFPYGHVFPDGLTPRNVLIPQRSNRSLMTNAFLVGTCGIVYSSTSGTHNLLYKGTERKPLPPLSGLPVIPQPDSLTGLRRGEDMGTLAVWGDLGTDLNSAKDVGSTSGRDSGQSAQEMPRKHPPNFPREGGRQAAVLGTHSPLVQVK